MTLDHAEMHFPTVLLAATLQSWSGPFGALSSCMVSRPGSAAVEAV